MIALDSSPDPSLEQVHLSHKTWVQGSRSTGPKDMTFHPEVDPDEIATMNNDKLHVIVAGSPKNFDSGRRQI